MKTAQSKRYMLATRKFYVDLHAFWLVVSKGHINIAPQEKNEDSMNDGR
jgi:hypothetical protein